MSTWAGRPRLTFTRRYATETKLGGAAVRGLKPIVGEPTIRGLKPTAKFSGRYAAEMRCSPRPTAHVHGFPSYGVGIPKSTSLCAGNHDTAGLRSSRVASATVEFSPAFQRRGMGFNPRITAPPMPPSRQRRLNLARRFNAGVWVSTHGSRLPTHPHAGGTPALPASSRSDG